jgi:hypothetical protein
MKTLTIIGVVALFAPATHAESIVRVTEHNRSVIMLNDREPFIRENITPAAAKALGLDE